MPDARSRSPGRPPQAKDVNEYLAALPEEARVTLETVRKTIKAAVPEAVEVISYQMPAFRYKGRMLVWFAAWKAHCSLYPMSEAIREACGDELKVYDTSQGTLRFPIGKPLPDGLVVKLVKARIAENEARATSKGKHGRR